MILNEAGEGREWTVKQEKTLIDRRVKLIGVANENGEESDYKLV